MSRILLGCSQSVTLSSPSVRSNDLLGEGDRSGVLKEYHTPSDGLVRGEGRRAVTRFKLLADNSSSGRTRKFLRSSGLGVRVRVRNEV